MIKQRITLLSNYIEQETDTEGLEFSEELVTVPKSIYYSRQDRVTIPIEHISPDLAQHLSTLGKLRIQWKAPGAHPSEIFQNFNQQGLYIHLVPSTSYYQESIDILSQQLSTSLGLKPLDNSDFIVTATSATYYSNLSIESIKLTQFISSLTELDQQDINNIEDFELNWDKESGLKVQWVSSPSDFKISKTTKIRKELAILQPKDLVPDIELAGIRTVLGQDYLPPTKTLIYIKPRHFPTSKTIHYELQSPIGLHPILKLSDLNYTPPSENCKLFWVSTVDNRLIFDKYQYDEKKFQLLQSWGETDLEAPVWKVSKFGSIQFLEVLNKTNLEMTYHSRYIEPSSDGKTVFLTPNVFYACDSPELIEDHQLIEKNLFDSYGLGYESFFDKDTIFFHFENEPKTLEFNIPTAKVEDFNRIQLTTLSVVSIGTLYLLYKLFRTFTTNTSVSSSKKSA